MVEAVSYLSNCMDTTMDKGEGKTLMMDKDIMGASFAQAHTGGKHFTIVVRSDTLRGLVKFVTPVK